MSRIPSSYDALRRHAPHAPLPARIVWVVLGLGALPFLWIGATSVARGLELLGRGQEAGAAFHLTEGLACLAAAGGLLLLARHAWRTWHRRLEVAQRHPEEPWLWRPEWATPVLCSRDHPGLLFAWAFVLFWLVVTIPGSVHFARDAWAEDQPLKYAFALFPVLGIAMLAWVAYRTRRWLRFGESRFRMEPWPAPPGGELAGVLLARGIESARAVDLRLACVRRVRVDSDTTEEEVLWSDAQRVPLAAAGREPGGLAVPVRFALPVDAPPSDALSGDQAVVWRLTAGAALPGVDYATAFEVPVFRRGPPAVRGAEPAPPGRSDVVPEPDAGEPDAGEPDAPPSAASVRVRRRADGLELAFPTLGRFGLAAFFTALGAVFAFVAWVAAREDVMEFVWLPGAFAAILLHSALHLLGGTTRVRVRPDGVTIHYRLFGLGPRRHVPASHIADVEVAPEVRYGKTQYWELRLVPRLAEPGWTGKRGVRAGGHVPDRAEAERVAARMRGALGLGG